MIAVIEAVDLGFLDFCRQALILAQEDSKSFGRQRGQVGHEHDLQRLVVGSGCCRHRHLKGNGSLGLVVNVNNAEVLNCSEILDGKADIV